MAVYKKDLVDADRIDMDDIFTPVLFSVDAGEVASARLMIEEEGIPTRMRTVRESDQPHIWSNIARLIYHKEIESGGLLKTLRAFKNVPIYILGILEGHVSYALVRFDHEGYI
jgi:hypothetical protein